MQAVETWNRAICGCYLV